MKTIVQVSPPELVRMLALAVLGRPENAGKCVAGVELEQDPASQELLAARVIVFDTMAEAQGYTVAPADVRPRAQVLSLVPDPPRAASGYNAYNGPAGYPGGAQGGGSGEE